MFKQLNSQSSQKTLNFSSKLINLLPMTTTAIALFMASAAPASATPFSFSNITGNSAANALAGEQQLRIDVSDASGGMTSNSTQALFKFSNVGLLASSITQIYFDNGSALGSIASIFDSDTGTRDNVSFSAATGNLNLPGGNSLSQNFVSNFGLKANTPVSQKGVNAGSSEWVSVLFNLSSGKRLGDVISEISGGSLRIGMHVQAFGNGGSEAFVNRPNLPTPSTPIVSTPSTPIVSTPSTPIVSTPSTPTTEPNLLVSQLVISSPISRVPEPGTIAALSMIALAATMKRRQAHHKQ